MIPPTRSAFGESESCADEQGVPALFYVRKMFFFPRLADAYATAS
jgi:hypothetical protein